MGLPFSTGFGWDRVNFLCSSWYGFTVCICAGNNVDNSWIFLLLLSSACTESSPFPFLTPHPTTAEGFGRGHSCLQLSRGISHTIVGCAELSVGLSRPPRLTPFPLPWENIHAAASFPCVLVSFFILCLCGTLALREVQMCPVVLKEWLFTALCLPCASSSPPIPC